MEDVRGKTVLVVDDEPNVRLYLQTVLEDSGFEVQTAANGHQALDRMTEKKPDVISLDLVMPKMSGLNFFKYIQKNKDRAGIPVVVVTAHAKDELGSEDFQKIEKYRSKECKIFTLEKPVDAPTYVNRFRGQTGNLSRRPWRSSRGVEPSIGMTPGRSGRSSRNRPSRAGHSRS
jgi:CheY-like chemotaxis protein